MMASSFMRGKMRIQGILLAIGLCGGSIFAQTLAKPAVTTITAIQAELLADMEARNLKSGENIYAKVTAKWNDFGCVLREGAVLEAQVVSVVPHSKTSNASEVALSFTGAQCAKSAMEPYALVLVAVTAPQRHDEGSLEMDMPREIGTSAAGFRSANSANMNTWYVMEHAMVASQAARAGGVLGIKGLKLSVGIGPQNSSVLSSADRNVALDKHSVLYLVPGTVAAANAKTQGGSQPVAAPAGAPDGGPEAGKVSGSATADASSNRDQTAQAAPDDAEICTPPECSIALPMGEPESVRHAMANISIKELGYTSRLEREMEALNHDEALTYLSSTELLVTFNPHPLVPRHGVIAPGSTVRVIRAALVDVSNKKVTRTADWYLPDTKQYLWLLSNHRVLVHVGNELRVYGPGLKVEARIGLGAPLSFVRTDPAGKTIAIGVVQERHTPELHAKLQEGQEEEPEEDVRIMVLNEKFDTIATAMSTSDRMPPTLLNEGEVKLLRQPDNRFHLVIYTWDNKWRSLAHFNSGCIPQLSSVAPDLLFIVTCDEMTGGREYRVMRPNGKLILRGESSLAELGHAAIGNEDKKEFAVKILRSHGAMQTEAVFRPTDLESELLSVYRATNGKRLFNVRVSDPTASNGGYALAPDGSQLAVLTRGQIELYALPEE
jgi:hypothetical protein